MKNWFLAARPHTLSASVVPVLVGSTLAASAESFSWLLFGLTLAGSVLVQIGANLTDEYADHDATESKKKFPAPHKVIALGLLTPLQVKRGALTVFALATLLGGYLVWVTGWELLLVCLLALATAWAYSAGPLPLGDLGLGELLVMVFMGPVSVLGTVYVQTHQMDWGQFFVSLPVGGLVTAILITNNLRDVEEDRSHNRVTLATRWGTGWVKTLYLALVLLAYLIPVALMGAGWVGSWAWLTWLALPLGLHVSRRVVAGGTPEFRHQTLKRTSLHHMVYGLLLSLVFLLEAWL
ncbi:MAG: 1,4-dihydroxy-2-naphthoate octaprenyltransferase [Deltaproteobacteria bacterium]|nr:1,4-dihydroxy-2-naphthoate octaprenyltransferase [Deltaproteobacteria bacterium]